MRGYDLTGERFGRLVVSNRNGSKHKEKLWLCKCDCGKEHLVQTSYLKEGSTRSCGCLKIDLAGTQVHKLPDKEAVTRRVMNIYRDSAKRRNIMFALTYDIVSNLIFKNCYYCGKTPSNNQLYNNRYEKLKYGGIDRVNNSLGYTEDNVVPCCADCNFLKHRVPMFIARKMMEFSDANRD